MALGRKFFLSRESRAAIKIIGVPELGIVCFPKPYKCGRRNLRRGSPDIFIVFKLKHALLGANVGSGFVFEFRARRVIYVTLNRVVFKRPVLIFSYFIRNFVCGVFT